MPTPAQLAPRAHAAATATLCAGFALAALASLTTFFALHAAAEAGQALRAVVQRDTRAMGGLFDMALLLSQGSHGLVLVGAFGVVVALAPGWRMAQSRRILLVAPALVVVAVLAGPLLHEYAAGVQPARAVSKVPFLLAIGGVLAFLVARSRAALALTAAGTAALVAGALQASLRTAWTPLMGVSLPPLAWENACAAGGFTLLAVALAVHAHRTGREQWTPLPRPSGEAGDAADAREPGAGSA